MQEAGRVAEAEAFQRMAARADEDELEIVGEKVVPFSIDTSHKQVVEIGGYVGCMRCGRIASRANPNNRLSKLCRGECPEGSKGPTQRMAAGKHPLGKRGKEWPDGSDDPVPRIRLL